ncbi:MAG: tRNA (adenosine(37)-N6)-threonylcarbamoyltransferase complex dimerization subunit type 1 TsaB [Dehalococcoidia bacterium]
MAIELTIDTASDYAGLALTDGGRLIHERVWYCRRRHSAEVLPAIDDLLRTNDVGRSDLGTVIACTGPGSYTGLRVGITLAKTLAYALHLPAVGVPRLLADAATYRGQAGSVCAVHRAGRSDLAVAVYGRQGHDPMAEVSAPRLLPLSQLADSLPVGCAVVGEVPEELVAGLEEAGHEVIAGLGGQRRPSIVARLGLAAIEAGAEVDPQALLPIYLRAAVQSAPTEP